MSDPLRTDPLIEAPADRERDAKIESLLLTGLDHYFSSDYAQAIDVWTRALFLDRSHARARAYIERARTALAEQQRESEELLHSGVEAFERGEMDAARQLLNAAVQRGGAHEVALAFLTRIDRISAASTPAVTSTVHAHAPVSSATVPARRFGGRMLVTIVLGVAVLAAIGYTLTSWDEVRSLIPIFGDASQAGLAPAPAIQDPLVVPRSSETAMERANTLFTSGHLYDALRALELVRPTDPLKGDADKLKETIQRALLAHQQSTAATAP